MNLIKAFEQREQLNHKMSCLLLQGLQNQLTEYRKAVSNYPPDRMEKYGTPFILGLEEKIKIVEELIEKKFI